MASTDEHAMRKRLLYDGHGTGEDRRIVNMSKNIAKFCLDSDKDDQAKLNTSVLKDITTISTIASRQIQLSERCDRSCQELELAIEEQNRLLNGAKEELSNLQLELEYVEQLKKVSVYPDCGTTKNSIDEVEKKKEQLMERLKKYRLQLKIVVDSCRNLRRIFDDNCIDSNEIEFDK